MKVLVELTCISDTMHTNIKGEHTCIFETINVEVLVVLNCISDTVHAKLLFLYTCIDFTGVATVAVGMCTSETVVSNCTHVYF